MRSSPPRNSNSCVASDHAGNLPPAVETLHFPPGPANARTKISPPLNSLEEYAMNLPSGENAASTSTMARSVKKGCGLPGLGWSGSVRSIGSVQRSGRDPLLTAKTNRPSGANEVGRGFNNLSRSAWRSPEPSARVNKLRLSPKLAARVDRLAEKANEGELKPRERTEYQAYVKTSGLLTLLQLRARLKLRLPIPAE